MGILTGAGFGTWAANIFYGILLSIDYVIYMIINVCYQLFEVVSKVEVFTTENVGVISRRIYTIIGIVMLFVFAYNIILSIIDPDQLNKGDKSIKNIIQNTIISIVLVTLFPLICEYMQLFQDHIVENNTLGNLIMGSTASDSGENGTTKGALNVSVTIFTAFYHPLNENKEAVTLVECEDSSIEMCEHYRKLAEEGKNSMSGLYRFFKDPDLKQGISDEKMEYLFPLSTIAGVVAAYLFLSFSLDLGVRAAKLGALKLIAPVPILLRITKPKGGIFDKWFGEFSKTYLQIFERIIIINFAMLLIGFVSDINVFASGGSALVNIVATVVVILGILKFAKDAPKLIEEIFSVKIPEMSIKKKLNDNEYAKRAATLGGAVAARVPQSLFNSGKAFVEGFKKDQKGQRHIARGLARGALGLAGVVPTALNAGRRGWQNGNVSDWSEVKGAIRNARTQEIADINAIKNDVRAIPGKAVHLKDTVVSEAQAATQDPKAWVSGKINTLDDFLNNRGVSNEKLAAAQAMKSKFTTLFDAFTDPETESARKGALKDYQNGKSVRFRKEIKGKDGTLYAAGTAVPVTNLDDGIINAHFEELQRETLKQKFNDAAFGSALKDEGKIICSQMEKTLNTLGDEARKAVLDANGITSIDELGEIFTRASEQLATPDDIAKLRDVSKAINKQVKANTFASTVEKQKDKK